MRSGSIAARPRSRAVLKLSAKAWALTAKAGIASNNLVRGDMSAAWPRVLVAQDGFSMRQEIIDGDDMRELRMVEQSEDIPVPVTGRISFGIRVHDAVRLPRVPLDAESVKAFVAQAVVELVNVQVSGNSDGGG